MSVAHNEHQSLIRTPKQLVVAVAGFFLAGTTWNHGDADIEQRLCGSRGG